MKLRITVYDTTGEYIDSKDVENLKGDIHRDRPEYMEFLKKNIPGKAIEGFVSVMDLDVHQSFHNHLYNMSELIME